MRARYQHPLRDYETVFSVKERQLKRWIEIGRRATPVELPPLDDPPLMRDWWVKFMRQRVPQRLLQLAVDAAKSASNPATGDFRAASINVKTLDVTSLNTLHQARGYLVAVDQKLSVACEAGNEDDIRRWQGPWERAMEAVRKAEAADLLRQKSAGEMLSKAEVLEELANFLSLFKIMRSSMAGRVVRRLDWNDWNGATVQKREEFKNALHGAIEAERLSEESFLRRLHSIQSLGEIELQLEAEIS